MIERPCQARDSPLQTSSLFGGNRQPCRVALLLEDLLAVRGIEVSFRTVAECAGKFGGEYARRIRQAAKGHFADKWHLDEIVIYIKGA